MAGKDLLPTSWLHTHFSPLSVILCFTHACNGFDHIDVAVVVVHTVAALQSITRLDCGSAALARTSANVLYILSAEVIYFSVVEAGEIVLAALLVASSQTISTGTLLGICGSLLTHAVCDVLACLRAEMGCNIGAILQCKKSVCVHIISRMLSKQNQSNTVDN